MTRNSTRCFLFVATAFAGGDPLTAVAGPIYSVEILNDQAYPQLKDSWMFRINNNGLAAGYIATASAHGPYLPATYSGGQFRTFGLQSNELNQTVSGVNDRGDIVGTLFDKNYNQTPYIVRGGVVSYPAFPDNSYPYMYGINNAGLAYGAYYDDAAGLGKVFTTAGDTVTALPLEAVGFPNFDSGPGALTASGLLGVTGFSDDYSTSQGFLDELATGTLTPLALPDGFANFSILKVTESGPVFGQLYSADYSATELGEWGRDGTFLGALDLPAGADIYGVKFNNLGQAVVIANGQLMFYDGSSWAERDVLGLNGYTLTTISDYNDRGEFVGLARNPAGGFEWGFVAHPVPEPGSLTLSLVVLGCGGVSLIYGRRRARVGRTKEPGAVQSTSI